MPVRVLRTNTIGSESENPCNLPGFSEHESFKSFLWGCKLDKDSPEFEYKFHEDIDPEDEPDDDFLINTLILKQALLLSKPDDVELNVIEIETKTFKEEVIKQPLACLTSAQRMMSLNDLEFRQAAPITLRLIQGNGPVYVTGLHQSEIPMLDEDDYGQYNDTETEVTEEDEEESPEKPVKKGLKRKARKVLLKKKVKKQAMDEEEEDEDDEEDDEDAENGTDATDGTEEESMEDGTEGTEEGTEESDEDEEEPAKKVKKPTTQKGTPKQVKKIREVKKLSGSLKKSATKSRVK